MLQPPAPPWVPGVPGWVHPPFPASTPFPQQTLPWLPAFHRIALKGGLPPTWATLPQA